MFGLSTVVFGDYERLLAPDTPVQRASIDILAANERSKLLLIVSCTLNSPKDEISVIFAMLVKFSLVRSLRTPEFALSPCCLHHRWAVPPTTNPKIILIGLVIDADAMRILLELLKSGEERRFFEFLANPMGLTASSQPR